MPRPLRIEYPGARYHVMNRGDRREAIFADDQDRVTFVWTLGEACGKTGWEVHWYCLMGNHFHAVVETPQANLAAGIRWLLGTYTQRFNRRHRQSGHLFGGRYKAQLIDERTPGYLLQACNYVHLNPARAGLVKPGAALDSHGWSSYPAYLRVGLRPSGCGWSGFWASTGWRRTRREAGGSSRVGWSKCVRWIWRASTPLCGGMEN